MRYVAVLILTLGLLGCGSQLTMKQPPASVSGTVSQSGQPAGGVVIVFQPLGDGHPRELPVHKDGTFQGEFVSGEYAYYVARSSILGAGQPTKKLPPKYFAADLSRTVTVEPGKQLAIVLD
jgi:hypothetical protein